MEVWTIELIDVTQRYRPALVSLIHSQASAAVIGRRRLHIALDEAIAAIVAAVAAAVVALHR